MTGPIGQNGTPHQAHKSISYGMIKRKGVL
jgi:hypothetical protein